MALTDLNIQVKDMAVGYGHYLAIGTDGSLYSWGLNSNGQLGLGDKTNRSNPTKVGTAVNWTKVACGDYHSLALNDKGEVYGWGINNVAQSKPSYNATGFVGSDLLSPTKWVNPTSDAFYDFYNGPYLDIAANGNCSLATIAVANPRRRTHPSSTQFYSGNLLGTGTTESNIVFSGPGPFGPSTSNAYYMDPVIGKMAFGKNSFAFQDDSLIGIYYTGKKGNFQTISQGSYNSGYHFSAINAESPSRQTNKATPPFKLRRKKTDAERNKVYPTQFPLETDNNRYIDFDLGDEFLLAIDSTNRLWGMSWATGNHDSLKRSTVAPSSPVGNFGWVLFLPTSTNAPTYVDAGLELLDESRLWLNVSCGARHAILSDVDGNIFSMGNNKYGQLGRDYSNKGNITSIGQLESPANTSGFNIHACGPQASLIAKS
tara:strand:+ start:389 stop:1675 length:1287 start_codon:yes stop_codon:yes gene_type:complete